MTSVKADTITGTSGITNFLQSPTMPTQLYTTNNNYLATTASANGLTATTHLTTNTEQTMIGTQTFNTFPVTIPSIDATGVIQVGSNTDTDTVRLGGANSIFTINGFLQSLTGFNNFYVGSNSIAGEIPSGAIPLTKKIVTGRGDLTGITDPTLPIFLDVAFTVGTFSSIPVVCLTPTSLSTTVLTNRNFWVTDITIDGFRINTYNTTADNKFMNWVAVGI
jgi:hypothetical protein